MKAHRKKSLAPSVWQAPVLDPAKRAAIAERPLPRRMLVIYFTPRSGSSWLTEALCHTKRMGHGNELFNPNFIPRIAESLQSSDRADYLDLARRRFSRPNGIFSMEVTGHHIDHVFPDTDAFSEIFAGPDSAPVWLIRRDIVAQAVSLAKMVTTRVSHSRDTNAEARHAAEQSFAYDADLIANWLTHIRRAEIRCEALFETYSIEPQRIAYEDTIAAGPERTCQMLARLAGVRNPVWPPFEMTHQKLGTGQNNSYAARFRREHPDLFNALTEERAPMLAALQPIAP